MRSAAFTKATEVTVLVNNAGFGTYGTFAGLDAGHEHAEVMVNAVAAVDLAHAVLPDMLASGGGAGVGRPGQPMAPAGGTRLRPGPSTGGPARRRSARPRPPSRRTGCPPSPGTRRGRSRRPPERSP